MKTEGTGIKSVGSNIWLKRLILCYQNEEMHDH
jgi:hypothetical protein